MIISDSINKLISSYQKGTQDNLKITKTSLQSLKANDEVKVSVEKVMDGGALVSLPSGEEFSISGNMQGVKEGMMLDIRIISNRDGQPLEAEILEIEKILGDRVDDLKSLLKDLGIGVTKENLSILNDMNKNGITITKDNVSKIFDSMKTLNVSKDNAIFMLKNDIEVTTESVRAFNSMITNSDFLESNLKVLINTLTEAINGISENINSNIEANNVNNIDLIKSENNIKELLNINVESEVDNVNNLEQNKNVLTNVNQVNNLDPSENENMNVQAAIEEANEMLKEEIAIDKFGPQNVLETEKENLEVKENINQYTDFEFGIVEEENIQENIQINKKPQEITLTKEAIVVNNESENITPENKNVIKENVTQNINDDVSQEKENSFATQEAKPVIKNETDEKMLAKLNPKEIELLEKEALQKQEELKDPNIRKEKLMKIRDEVVGIFREVHGSKDLSEEISIKRIFKSFRDVIDDIENNKDLFERNVQDNVTKETSRMKENLELISDLNKYNTVVHIPLVINDNKAVAQLYVFNGDKNNSKRKINENNATMFLSLGTANIGQVESYIKVVNKTVECNFMTETELGTNFINENKNHLSELLKVYGYTLIKADAKTYTPKALNIFEAIEKNKKDEVKKGFDEKA